MPAVKRRKDFRLIPVEDDDSDCEVAASKKTFRNSKPPVRNLKISGAGFDLNPGGLTILVPMVWIGGVTQKWL
jgi:hypothetical protein